ncbi:uncharacterized protein METZ01_LOCUS379203, partial [marine metagenome]
KGENMCSKLILNSYKIVRITVLNLIVVTVLLLTGCAMKFPVPDETNQTMLIIPVETRQTLRQFVFTLDISIEDSANKNIVHHQIEPNPKMLFSYNTQLKPGKYKITEMNRQAKPGFKLGGQPRPERISEIGEFELEKGKITIIDKMFLFQQPKPDKKRERKDMRNMTGAQRMQERKKQKDERKAEQKAMKKQRVRFAQVVDLEGGFKTKLMEALKEVENIDQWKLE